MFAITYRITFVPGSGYGDSGPTRTVIVEARDTRSGIKKAVSEACGRWPYGIDRIELVEVQLCRS